MSTISSAIKWAIEIYPFGSNLPTSSETNTDSPYAVVSGSAGILSEVVGIVDGIFNPKEADEADEIEIKINATLGVKSISIARDKSRPDNECTISTVGPLSSDILAGNWVVVSSAQGDAPLISSIQFIGQIESVSVNYSADAKGTIQTDSSIILREWSTILTSELVYDYRSMYTVSAQTGAGLKETGVDVNKLGGFGGTPQAVNDFAEALEAAFCPLETAHIILRLMGLIEDADTLDKAKVVKGQFFTNLAQSPPKIPVSILKRLGISPKSAGSGNYETSWNNGFVKVVTGIDNLEGSFPYTQGQFWDGVFENVGGTDTIATFSKLMRIKYDISPYKRRQTSALLTLTNNYSAWSVMSDYCEPAINEIYTDLWHIKKGNTVTARPVIVTRVKPFMTYAILNNTLGEFPEFRTPEIKQAIEAFFPLYDDLPTIEIDATSVHSVNFNNTFLTSPNYIRVNNIAGTFDRGSETMKGALGAPIRLGPEQDRFGGQSYGISTNYLVQVVKPLSPGLDTPSHNIPGLGKADFWFTLSTELSRCWYSYLYRMATATLLMVDDNLSFSVGFNARFKVGFFTLVGHIESISTDYTIDSSGVESTITKLGLSRIMPVDLFGRLEYMPPGGFGLLYDEEFFKEFNTPKEYTL